MKPRTETFDQSGRRSGQAFTLTDLLVSVAAISVMALVVVVWMVNVRGRSRLARCSDNLQQVGRAILSYSGDHNQQLPGIIPDQPGDLWWWYKEQVKRYAGLSGPSGPQDTVFACPDDRGYTESRPFHATPRFDYGSYVFNGVTLAGVPSIAGWQLPAIRDPRKTLLVMEWTAHAPLSWHKSRTGRRNAPFYCDAESVVTFVDGHVRMTRIYYDGYNAAYTQDPSAAYDYKYRGNQ